MGEKRTKKLGVSLIWSLTKTMKKSLSFESLFFLASLDIWLAHTDIYTIKSGQTSFCIFVYALIQGSGEGGHIFPELFCAKWGVSAYVSDARPGRGNN